MKPNHRPVSQQYFESENLGLYFIPLASKEENEIDATLMYLTKVRHFPSEIFALFCKFQKF